MRRITALILGLIVLSLVSLLFDLSKESGTGVNGVDDNAAEPAVLPIRITAYSNGDIRVDGRLVDPGE